MQLPPVERVDLLESGPGHESCKSMRAEHRTLVLARQSLQRGHVEVIVVIVADENAVDGRNILEKPPSTSRRTACRALTERSHSSRTFCRRFSSVTPKY